MDAVEALPEELPTEQECQAVGDRYDGQRAIFGERMQRALQEKVRRRRRRTMWTRS